MWIAACLFFLPGLPVALLGGLAFGPVWGTVYSSAGSTIGATLAFLVARYAARDMVEGWVAGSAQFKKIDEGVERQGWRILMVTRLVPAFPFNLQNFAYGLTCISLPVYAAVSWVCMLPGTIAFSFAGGSLTGGGDLKNTFMIMAVVILSQFLTGTSWPMRLAWRLGLVDAPGGGLVHALPGLGVALVYVWKGLPFVLIVVSTHLLNMDTLLVEAARSLGATAIQAVFSVTLPLLKKTLLGCFVLLSAFSFCSFEVPFLIGPTTPRVLPVAIFALYTTPGLESRAAAMAASVVLAAFSMALFGVYRLCFARRK